MAQTSRSSPAIGGAVPTQCMYGTISRMKPKPGQESTVVELLREWGETRGKTVAGYRSSYLYRPDNSPEEVVLVVAFEDKQSYDLNAGDSEQDKWYRRLSPNPPKDGVRTAEGGG